MEYTQVVSASSQHRLNDLKHLASMHFHIYVWFAVILMLGGNCVVILWRCTRPALQRNSALSIMIVNLSLVDFLYGVHLLLVESAVMGPVFEGNLGRQNVLQARPTVDGHLCYTAYFLSLLSNGGQSVAIFCIAAYTFLSLWYPLQSSIEKLFVAGSIVIQWALAVIMASISTFGSNWQPSWNMSNVTESPVNIEVYFVLTQCSCPGALDPSLTSIVTMELALICLATILYVAFLVMLARRLVLQNNEWHSEDAKYLLIRLCVVVAINILCWGPPLVLYYFGKKSISNVLMLLKDDFCLSITEVSTILLSIPPAINPLIYTIGTKQFLGAVKRMCALGYNRTRSVSQTTSEPSESSTLFPEENTSPPRYDKDIEILIFESGEHEQTAPTSIN